MSIDHSITEARGARAIEVDEQRYPLVIARFRGVATDAAFEEYLATLDGLLSRRQRYVAIIDTTAVGRTPTSQLKRQAEWQKARATTLETYSLGLAFVINSPLVRGALTTVLWIQPLSRPHIIAATIEAAERWAIDTMARAGIHVRA